jgi:N-acyl-D-aspartate/D-glutamate deacylase
VIALTVPRTPGVYMNLRNGVMFDALPGLWREVFKQPLAERMATLRDPAIRRRLADDAASLPDEAAMKSISNLPGHTVISAVTEANKRYEGRRIDAIAAEEGRAPIDVMLDIALADDLETVFLPDQGGDDRASWDLRGQLWADDRTIIGASDAGAHLDLIDTFDVPSVVLGKGVREHGIITMEAAIHQLTARPAAYFGLIDRGAIREGYRADLVVFDPATIGCRPVVRRHDLPGSTEDYRLYAEAEGIDQVLVNGVQIVSHGRHTGALPGTLLRSGRDTRTVAMDAMRVC